MPRIHEQDLSGNEAEANDKAIWTWSKNEKSWRYCKETHSISHVKFTGGRWLIGDKHGRNKFYQFEIISSTNRLVPERISHDIESSLFETLESARDYALKHIDKIMAYQAKVLQENKNDIIGYCAFEKTFERKVLTSKKPKKHLYEHHH